MAGTKGIEAGRAFVKLFGDDTDLEKTLKGARLKLRNFAGAVNNIGRTMLMAGLAIATPLVGATKVYADFSQQMASVATMLDRPAEHLGRFGDEIRRMSVEFAEGTDTLSKGLYQILSASIPPAKALQVLEVSVRAARAGMSDAYIAADAITTILNSYGMAAERAGEVSDWLFRIVRRGKTTFGELAPVMGLVAAPAAQAGIDLDEMGAVISTLTRAGLRTEVVMTALMNAIKSFLKPSDDAAAAARAFGIELNTATIRSMGLFGVLQKLSALDPETIGRIFPNMRSLRGVLAAVQNIEGVTFDLAQMQQKAGSTTEAFDKAIDSLAFRFAQLRAAVTEAARSIGEKLAPLAESVIARLKGWTAILRDLNAGLVTGAANLSLLAVGLGAVLMIVGKLTMAMTLLMTPVGLWVAGIAAAAIGIGYGVLKLVDALTTTREEAEETANRADHLAERYKELVDKTHRTAEETGELKNVMAELKGILPELADSIDGTAESIERLADAMGEGRLGKGLMLKYELANLEKLNKQWIRQRQSLLQAREAVDLFAIRPAGAMFESVLEGAQKAQKAVADTEDKIKATMQAIRALRLELEPDLAADFARAMKSFRETHPGEPGPETRVKYIDISPTEAEMPWIHEAARLRLSLIEDELVREMALVNLRYDREVDKALEAGERIHTIELSRLAELEAVQAGYREKRAREEQRAAEDLAEYQRQIVYDLAAEQIRAATDGLEERLALLDLERRRAVQEAMEAQVGAQAMDQLQRTYDLRARALIAAGQQAPSARAQGTFSSMVARILGGGGDAGERTARATEKTAKYMERYWQWVQNQRGFVFG